MGISEEQPFPIVLPSSVEEFQAWRNEVAVTPFGGAAAFVAALITLSENEELGWQCIIAQTDNALLQKSASAKHQLKGWSLRNIEAQRLKERIIWKPHVARSYVQGTSPENQYTMPSGEKVVLVYTQDVDKESDDGVQKVFVRSTGADSARPIKVKKNNRGLYKAHEWSSLGLDCRKPIEAVDDDL